MKVKVKTYQQLCRTPAVECVFGNSFSIGETNFSCHLMGKYHGKSIEVTPLTNDDDGYQYKCTDGWYWCDWMLNDKSQNFTSLYEKISR